MEEKQKGFNTLREALKNQAPGARAPRVVVLVGIPGSGKSTFANRIVQSGWARVSQDDLGGNRRAVERAVVRLLAEGRDVVVDRCNFDAAQRKHWIDYGRARGCVCGAVVFGTAVTECVRRVRNRTDHPTLNGDKDNEDVVVRMMNDFVFPSRAEGFAFCRVVRDEEDFERVAKELAPPGAA